MRADELIQAHPQVYHMAWEGSWPSIQRHGLLSTEALLDCWEVDDAQKRPLMETHRPEAVTIDHPDFGRATVRDQKPVSDEGLQRCLEGGLEPRDWYRLLNQRVFFWATQERLDALLGARAYRDSRHTVLTVDTSTLVSRYGDEIELTTMNTGCTVPFPHARGLASFTPLRDFDYAASRRKRGRGRAIVEIVVLRGIPDLTDFVVTVEHRGGGLPAKVLFER